MSDVSVIPGGGGGGGGGVAWPDQAVGQDRWLWGAVLVLLALVIYSGSFSRKFLWDDDRHAAAFGMRDVPALGRIWTKVGAENQAPPQYYPVTQTMFWLEYRAFGRDALGYRVVNVLLHAGAALVLWEVLRRLGVPGAFVAAAVFVAHPINVESVAWVTEGKNTLSALLGLGCVACYLRFAGIGEREGDRPAWGWYGAAVGLLVAALLAKTTTACIPVWIAAILWWKRRLDGRQWALLAPMFVVAVGLGLFTGFVEYRYVMRADETVTFGGWLAGKVAGGLKMPPEFGVTPVERVLRAGRAVWFYVGTLVAPAELMFFHPRWDLAKAPGWWWAYPAGVVAGVGLLVAMAVKGRRAPLALGVAFLAAVFPAVGFVEVYPFRYSYVAEHFGYLGAIVGAVVIAVAGVAIVRGRPGVFAGIAAGLVVAALGARSWVHAGHFIDNYALFDHTVRANSGSWIAKVNLAGELNVMAEGALQTADLHRRNRLEDARVKADAVLSAGALREEEAARKEGLGFVARSEALVDEVLAVRPRQESAWLRKAEAAELGGDRDLALECYRKTIELMAANRGIRYVPAYVAAGRLISAGAGKYSDDERAVAAWEMYKGALTAGGQGGGRALEIAAREGLLRLKRREVGRSGGVPTERQAQELITLARALAEGARERPEGWREVGLEMYLNGIRRQEEGKLDVAKASYEYAAEAYRRAVELDTTNVPTIVRLGEAYGAAGDVTRSQVALESAVQMDPANGEAAELLRRLKSAVAKARPATTRATSGPTTVGGAR